jgi:hypothetical protein
MHDQFSKMTIVKLQQRSRAIHEVCDMCYFDICAREQLLRASDVTLVIHHELIIYILVRLSHLFFYGYTFISL